MPSPSSALWKSFPAGSSKLMMRCPSGPGTPPGLGNTQPCPSHQLCGLQPSHCICSKNCTERGPVKVSGPSSNCQSSAGNAPSGVALNLFWDLAASQSWWRPSWPRRGMSGKILLGPGARSTTAAWCFSAPQIFATCVSHCRAEVSCTAGGALLPAQAACRSPKLFWSHACQQQVAN